MQLPPTHKPLGSLLHFTLYNYSPAEKEKNVSFSVHFMCSNSENTISCVVKIKMKSIFSHRFFLAFFNFMLMVNTNWMND